MKYEIYSKAGLPIAIEHQGTLEEVLSLIGSSHFLIGVNSYGAREALFVRYGDNVLHVCECPDTEMERVITLKTP